MLASLLRKILSEKRYRLTAVIVFLLYVVLYLVVTRFIVFSTKAIADTSFGIIISEQWADLLFKQRSPFLFESIGALHITPYFTLFISIPNLILAIALSVLVALNITVSYYVFRHLGLRGSKGFISLLGTIPALLGGAACCVPTLIVVLGLQFTATLSAVWPWFIPLSFILLFASLVWSLKQATKRAEQPQATS